MIDSFQTHLLGEAVWYFYYCFFILPGLVTLYLPRLQYLQSLKVGSASPGCRGGCYHVHGMQGLSSPYWVHYLHWPRGVAELLLYPFSQFLWKWMEVWVGVSHHFVGVEVGRQPLELAFPCSFLPQQHLGAGLGGEQAARLAEICH